jgi:peptide deformylase
MILKVARLGHPVIRTKAQLVKPEDINRPEFQTLIDDMIETMYEYIGVGLAGPQVHLPLRLAVLEVANNSRYPNNPPVPLTVLINPVITVVNREPVEAWEGCLSIPDFRGLVPRFKEVRVEALGRKGEKLDFFAQDFHARVVQHETDHLNGEVYIDRLPNMQSLSYLAEWQRYLLEPQTADKKGSN